jgi:hypothetical protein
VPLIKFCRVSAPDFLRFCKIGETSFGPSFDAAVFSLPSYIAG